MAQGAKDRIIAEADLREFHPGQSLVGEMQALILQQQATWELARIGYKSLENVEVRTFDVNGITIRVQCNPGRMRSTTAKVDAQTIKNRPCFLCLDNLPPEQKGILYRDEYIILVNPYPIFPEHFTIPHLSHRPQRAIEEIEILLDLASDVAPEYVVFYNGARCGASAPDHLHFQAGSRTFLPLVDGYQNARARFGRLLSDRAGVKVYSIDQYLPALLALEADSIAPLKAAFDVLVRCMQTKGDSEEEPLINLLAWVDDGAWRLVVFPRSKHRPDRFFKKDEGRLLISPAAIDLAGVGVIPVEEDFAKVTSKDMEEVYEEVVLSSSDFRELTGALTSAFENF